MNFHDLVFYSKHHYRFECGVEIGGGAAKRAIRIQTVFPEMKAIPLPFTIRKKMKC